jgi:hypothetical protein
MNSSDSLHVEIVVEHALEQLRQLTRERQEIARRIAIIKRTINGLSLLNGGALQIEPGVEPTAVRKRGITNACRVVVNRAETPLSIHEVYATLQGEYPDLFGQSENRYASLVTILNRLVKYGEVHTFLRDGNRFWQRHQSADR